MARNKFALGLEYTGDEIRILLLESGDAGLEVRHTQVLRATEDLSRALRSLPRRPSSVVCSVSLDQAALRILSLPPTTDENLDRVVALEAESVLPIPADELALSHHMLGMTEQSRVEVLLGAARLTVVQNLLKRVNAVPWVSATVTVGPIALYNAVQQLRNLGGETVCAILKVEERHSELLVLDRTRILVAQPIPVGYGSAVEAPVGEPVAAGVREEGAPRAVPDGPAWCAPLAQQLRYALQALSYERGLSLQRLYLCGKGGGEAGADWIISEALDVPVSVLSPVGTDERGTSHFVTAYGCAVQAAGKAGIVLNLTPARVAVAREIEQRRQTQVSWAALAGAVVLAATLVFGAMVYNEKRALEQARTALAQVAPLASEAPSTLPGTVKKSAEAVSQELETRVSPSRLLTTLSRQLPTGTWLAELSYNAQGNTVVRGYSLDRNGAQQAQVRLLRMQMFDEVTLDYRTEEQVNNVPVWGFQLTCRLHQQEQQRRPRTTAR